MQQLQQKDPPELPREQPLTADAARSFSRPVRITNHHKQHCPYCKCKECQRAFSKRGSLDPSTFVEKESCTYNKKK
jgi:hypothetical protein